MTQRPDPIIEEIHETRLNPRMTIHKEIAFEDEIGEYLGGHGWI